MLYFLLCESCLFHSKILFEHKMKLFFVIFCLLLRSPQKCWFSQKIRIFTYDLKKQKLRVKWCKLNPKVVLMRFKNDFSSYFLGLLQKKRKQKIFLNRSNFGHFLKKLEKNTIFCWFFFDPPIFSAENRQTTKKILPDIPTA